MNRLVTAAMTLTASSAVVHAGVINLTVPTTSALVSNAIYETSDARSTGTGVIAPFVRLQRNGTQQGYNTSTRPVAFNELTAANFTRDLQIQDLGVNSISGTDYVTFLLDSNQAGNVTDTLLSLDQVRIYISPSNGLNSTDLSTLGTLVYSLDAVQDNWIVLNSQINSGSGQGDMLLHVPLSLFTPFSSSSYVTLYSQFGTNNPSNDGFEEWKTVGSPYIPAPGAATLLGLGGLVISLRRRN